jgi:hypothetical protein
MNDTQLPIETSLELFCNCVQGARSVQALASFDWTSVAGFYSSGRSARIRSLVQELLRQSGATADIGALAARASQEPPHSLYPGTWSRFRAYLFRARGRHEFPAPILSYVTSQLSRLVVGLDGSDEPDFSKDLEEGRLFRRELTHAAGLVEVVCGGRRRAFVVARSIEYFGAPPHVPGRTLDEILSCLRHRPRPSGA